ALKAGCRWSWASATTDAFFAAFKDEVDKAYCRLTLDGTLSGERVVQMIDEAAARFSLDDWMAGPAEQSFCADAKNARRRFWWDCRVPAAHQQMRTWARARTQTVMQRLKCQ